MAEYNKQRYYWIKLTDRFMTSDTVDFLMGQKDGANYVVLYQMLCLKTVNNNGELVRTIGEVIIPYDEEKIQRDMKYFSIDTIRVAMTLYKKLGLIYEQENGVFKIADFENLIGSQTVSAHKKQIQLGNRGGGKKVEKIPPDKDIDKERDIEIEKDIEIDIDIERKEIKKERKNGTNYDAIISENIHDEEVKEALYEFIKMRTLIKKPLTDRALQMIINKLWQLAGDNDTAIAVLNQSIINNWQDIYALKDERAADKSPKAKKERDTNDDDYWGDALDRLGRLG